MGTANIVLKDRVLGSLVRAARSCLSGQAHVQAAEAKLNLIMLCFPAHVVKRASSLVLHTCNVKLCCTSAMQSITDHYPST